MCSVTVSAREAREADWVEENVQFERRSTQYYKTREGIIKLTKKSLKEIEDLSLRLQSKLQYGLWFFGMFGLQQRPCGGGDSIVRHKP